MGYSIELHFDEETNDRIKEVWEKMERELGITNFQEKIKNPHLTLGIYDEEIDLDSLLDGVKSFASKMQKFSLLFTSLGVFNTEESVVFLAPKVTKELLDFHEDLLSSLSGVGKHLNFYYQEDYWVPHSTMIIMNSQEKTLAGLKMISEWFEPMEVTIEEITIQKFYPIEEIVSIKITG